MAIDIYNLSPKDRFKLAMSKTPLNYDDIISFLQYEGTKFPPRVTKKALKRIKSFREDLEVLNLQHNAAEDEKLRAPFEDARNYVAVIDCINNLAHTYEEMNYNKSRFYMGLKDIAMSHLAAYCIDNGINVGYDYETSKNRYVLEFDIPYVGQVGWHIDKKGLDGCRLDGINIADKEGVLIPRYNRDVEPKIARNMDVNDKDADVYPISYILQTSAFLKQADGLNYTDIALQDDGHFPVKPIRRNDIRIEI